ncbi:Gfo/Idh/MocA family oxidoreductase [Isosphaeraceae bacterium EP7]
MDAGNRDLGVLVVGVGFLGSLRTAAVAAARGMKLVAVLDPDEARARAVAARHAVCTLPDMATGLAMPGVDLVIVATPHSDHAQAVHAALSAGKHVLCEKPLATSPEDARALAYQADAAGLRLATGLNHRFYKPISDALDLIRSGALGRVDSVRATIGHSATAEFLSGWHSDPRISGGGTLADNGPHACDLIRHLLTEVVAVKGYVQQGLHLPEGCETEAFALFRNHDLGVGELHSSWSQPEGYLTLEIRGTQGHLRVETAPWLLTGRVRSGKAIRRRYVSERLAEKAYRWRHGCESSLVLELESFVEGLATGLPGPAATGWDGVRAAEMVAAVYESDRTGEEEFIAPWRDAPEILVREDAPKERVA